MTAGIAPLLERRPIFRSRDVEETRAFLHGKNYECHVGRQKTGELDTRLNGIYMPGFYIGYVQYGTLPVALTPPAVRSDYWIQLPVCGQLEAMIGGASVECNPKQAAIASPTFEECSFVSNAGSARIQVALPKSGLLDQLGALLGEPAERPLDFAPTLDLTRGHGQSLARYLLMAAVDLDQSDSVLLNPATSRMFEQLIINGLLLSQPHSYSEMLRQRERPIASRDVKRAIDYMQANLDTAVTLADLVAASGVPGRTLFKHFRDSKGASPMRYLRNARFQKVREALTLADPGDSVTAIAMTFGFSHMGRFAVEYRYRFGERPSETLKGRRKR